MKITEDIQCLRSHSNIVITIGRNEWIQSLSLKKFLVWIQISGHSFILAAAISRCHIGWVWEWETVGHHTLRSCWSTRLLHNRKIPLRIPNLRHEIDWLVDLPRNLIRQPILLHLICLRNHRSWRSWTTSFLCRLSFGGNNHAFDML